MLASILKNSQNFLFPDNLSQAIPVHLTIIFIFSIILLLIVLIPGVGVVRGGARSWISILGFSIQPSEFMKLGIILNFERMIL